MTVSIKSYLGTEVAKGFTAVDDFEKSDYQRVRNGKLEHVHDKRVKHEHHEEKKQEMKTIDFDCGCEAEIPEDMDENSEDAMDYLKEHDDLKVERVDVDRYNLVCGHCGKTLSGDTLA